MAFTGAAAGVTAVSSYNKAQGQKGSLKYQAAVQANDAKVAQYEASDAIRTGQIEEGNFDLKAAGMLSDQRASMAANGVDLGEGSPNDVLTSTKFMGERDALQIHDNAMKAAWGYQTQANNFLTNAAAYKAEGDAINPWAEAGGSLLTSASAAASNWTSKNAMTGKVTVPGPDGKSVPATAGQYASSTISGWFK